MKFSKDDTLCMKGIAILILFFHHNYLGPDRWLNSPISFSSIFTVTDHVHC